MAEWEKISLSTLFPSETKTLAQSASALVTPAAQLLEQAAKVVDAMADVLINFADPFTALLAALKAEILLFIGDLRTAGVYVLPVLPPDPRTALGTSGLLSAIGQSFDDLADADRPTFSASSSVLGYVMMLGATDLLNLYNNFLKKLGDLFDLEEIKTWRWVLNPGEGYVPPRVIRSANAKPPDWKKMTVGSLWPVYDELLKGLEQFVEIYVPGQETNDFIKQLALVLRNKADILSDLAALLVTVANELEALLQMDGVWFVKVTGNGVAAWKAALNAATNRPPFDPILHYTAGVVILSGGPDTAALERLLG